MQKPMQKGFKSLNRLFLFLVLCTSILAFLALFLPTRRLLKKESLDRFITMSELHFKMVEHFIQHSLDSSAALAGRSMIKKEIVKYHNGQISLTELKEIIGPLFYEGARASNSLTGALRVVDNQIVAEYGFIDPDRIAIFTFRTSPFYEIDLKGGKTFLIAYSPILADGDVIGFDLGFYEMTPIIANMSDDLITCTIEQNPFEKIAPMVMGSAIAKADATAFEAGKYTHYIRQLPGTDKYHHVYAANNVLYEASSKTTLLYLIIFSTTTVAIIVFANLFTLKRFRNLLQAKNFEKDVYMDLALKDNLTGAHSRLYLKNYLESDYSDLANGNPPKIISLIDIDGFKNINDSYGHSTGDIVLKTICNIINEEIRQKDALIRYGGDEFIIFFASDSLDDAEKTMQQICKRIKEHGQFDFPVRLSYGLETVQENDLFKAIKGADKKMYLMKKAARGNNEAP